MINRIKRHINGVKRYYARDGLNGVVYYIKHRIYNRLIKPVIYADWLVMFNPERQMAKRFERTIPIIDQRFIKMGNYFIYEDKAKLNASSANHMSSSEKVIYSLGVLSDTEFDEAVSSHFNCDVFLFDPSNIARDHLQKLNHPRFIFQQVGVWSETCEMTFSSPKYGGSPSMIIEYTGKSFTHQCVDIKEILAKHGHQQIDIIKLDIEGAALGVLNRLLEIQHYPTQIIAEFERPRTGEATDYFQFYSDLITLNNALAALGYQIYRLPREKTKYYSIELIFVRH